MRKRLITATAAAVALVTAPVAAQSALAQRAPAAMGESEEIAPALLLALAAAAAVATGIVVIADDDTPTSP